MTILYCIYKYGTIRFNELKRCINTISYKTLSTTLKELEENHLVHREKYPQIPQKIEYSLTKRDLSIMPILDCMCDWGTEHRNDTY